MAPNTSLMVLRLVARYTPVTAGGAEARASSPRAGSRCAERGALPRRPAARHWRRRRRPRRSAAGACRRGPSARGAGRGTGGRRVPGTLQARPPAISRPQSDHTWLATDSGPSQWQPDCALIDRETSRFKLRICRDRKPLDIQLTPRPTSWASLIILPANYTSTGPVRDSAI